MDEKAVEKLKGQVRGQVIVAGDARYDEAWRVYHAMIDKRPGPFDVCLNRWTTSSRQAPRRLDLDEPQEERATTRIISSPTDTFCRAVPSDS